MSHCRWRTSSLASKARARPITKQATPTDLGYMYISKIMKKGHYRVACRKLALADNDTSAYLLNAHSIIS